jgi:phosphoglucosamine mutase
VFEELGAEVIAIGNRPDGFNINDECGSTALAALMAMVDERRADVGIALDGDGDRCLMVRSDGTTVDGDELLFVIARHAQDTGRLKGPVVGTVMSNFGLERALLNQGIGFERAAVGDRYVLEKLRKLGGIIGGETSGHTLCLDKASTGDGIVTALQVLEVMLTTEKPLAELVSGMEKVPQVLINVPVGGNARGIAGDPRIVEAEAAARTALGDRGRLLVRASGTEPVVRVMVEALDAEEAERVAKEVADQVSEVGCASTAPAPVTS